MQWGNQISARISYFIGRLPESVRTGLAVIPAIAGMIALYWMLPESDRSGLGLLLSWQLYASVIFFIYSLFQFASSRFLWLNWDLDREIVDLMLLFARLPKFIRVLLIVLGSAISINLLFSGYGILYRVSAYAVGFVLGIAILSLFDLWVERGDLYTPWLLIPRFLRKLSISGIAIGAIILIFTTVSVSVSSVYLTLWIALLLVCSLNDHR